MYLLLCGRSLVLEQDRDIIDPALSNLSEQVHVQHTVQKSTDSMMSENVHSVATGKWHIYLHTDIANGLMGLWAFSAP